MLCLLLAGLDPAAANGITIMVTIAQALELAVQHSQAGRLPMAEQVCRQILRVDARNVGALHLLGVLALQVGRNDLAIDYFSQTLRLKPDSPEVLSNLGMALVRLERLPEALDCYRQALRIKPDFAEAHNNLANAFRKQGRMAEAVASYRQAVRLKPNYVEANFNLAVALLQQGNLTEAVTCCRQALRLKPDHAEAHSNLGVALLKQGNLTEAVASLQEALRLSPDIAEFQNNLGMALAEQGRLAEAEACYRQALRLKPDYAGAYSDLGVTLADQGRLTEAVACYQQALRLKQDYAEVHTNLAYACLLRGDFEAGWSEYEWRTLCRDSSPPQLQQPRWDGSSLQGRTILLFAEQGLGDTLHFIRYAPLVKQTGAAVIVQCQEPLLSLLGTCAGIDWLVPEGTEPPRFDVQAPLPSVPGLARTTLASIPAKVPYLSADPELRARWREALSGVRGFKVGIAWQGNTAHKRDRQRSVPLLTFLPLAGAPGVRLVSLQTGPGREQVPDHPDHLAVLDMADQLGDFADTAALVSNLDLVITVDTAVAHLAGAMGLPVWVALPLCPDWRWLLEREDSPWYPSMRLFRQTTLGDWSEVFDHIARALQQHMAARPF